MLRNLANTGKIIKFNYPASARARTSTAIQPPHDLYLRFAWLPATAAAAAKPNVATGAIMRVMHALSLCARFVLNASASAQCDDANPHD